MNRPPSLLSRRYVLQAAGLIGTGITAGCTTIITRSDSGADPIALSLTEATTPRVSNEYSTPIESLPYATEAIVRTAIDDGEATFRGYYSPEIPAKFVATGSNDQYYRITVVERDRREIPGYTYSVEISSDEPASAFENHIHDFTELPHHDQETLRSAIGNPGLLHAPHYTSFTAVFAYEDESLRDHSVFVPGSDETYVEWDDVLVQLRFEGQSTVPVTSATVTTELVAESPRDFARYLGNRQGVVLENLTSRQEEIITESIEDEYVECKPYSDTFSTLLDDLSTDEHRVAHLAQYQTNWYFTQIA